MADGHSMMSTSGVAAHAHAQAHAMPVTTTATCTKVEFAPFEPPFTGTPATTAVSSPPVYIVSGPAHAHPPAAAYVTTAPAPGPMPHHPTIAQVRPHGAAGEVPSGNVLVQWVGGGGGVSLPLGMHSAAAGMHSPRCLPHSHLPAPPSCATHDDGQFGVEGDANKRRKLPADERLERSRERNRIHARKTRLRRKQKMELLQGRRAELVEEQQRLRETVKDHEAAPILLEMRRSRNGVYNEGADVEVSRMTVGNVAEHNSLMDAQQRYGAAVSPRSTGQPFDPASGDEAEVDQSESSEEGGESGSFGDASSSTSSGCGRMPSQQWPRNFEPTVAIGRKDRSSFTPAELERLRRERNRMHAKRTRDRKKQAQEETELEIRRLEDENDRLRATINGFSSEGGRVAAALRRNAEGEAASAAPGPRPDSGPGQGAFGAAPADEAMLVEPSAQAAAVAATLKSAALASVAEGKPGPKAAAAPSALVSQTKATGPDAQACSVPAFMNMGRLFDSNASSETSSAGAAADSMVTSSNGSASSEFGSGSDEGNGSNNEEADSNGNTSPSSEPAAPSSESSSARNSGSENEDEFACSPASNGEAGAGGGAEQASTSSRGSE